MWYGRVIDFGGIKDVVFTLFLYLAVFGPPAHKTAFVFFCLFEILNKTTKKKINGYVANRMSWVEGAWRASED